MGINIEGYVPDQILSLPDEQLDAFVLSGRPIVFRAEALNDQVPHASRQALSALAVKTSGIDGERIWELLRSAAHEHVKRNALSLIERLSKWGSIYYLLRAVRDSDEAIADMSKFGIECWLGRFNRNFSSPTAEQLARLGIALEENGNLLDD